MTNKDIRYRRTNRFGVAQEKLVVWIPVETKERARRLAASRQQNLADVVTPAIEQFADRAERSGAGQP